MKDHKSSTMYLTNRVKFLDKNTNHLWIFDQLIKLLEPYKEFLKVRGSNPYNYELWTEHEYRTKSFRPQRKIGVLFAGASILKTHVGFYFYPIHINEDLKVLIPLRLKRLLFGKSAFHITTLTDELKDDIVELLNIGIAYYVEKGWLRKN